MRKFQILSFHLNQSYLKRKERIWNFLMLFHQKNISRNCSSNAQVKSNEKMCYLFGSITVIAGIVSVGCIFISTIILTLETMPYFQAGRKYKHPNERKLSLNVVVDLGLCFPFPAFFYACRNTRIRFLESSGNHSDSLRPFYTSPICS
jgi:hypothetical protein